MRPTRTADFLQFSLPQMAFPRISQILALGGLTRLPGATRLTAPFLLGSTPRLRRGPEDVVACRLLSADSILGARGSALWRAGSAVHLIDLPCAVQRVPAFARSGRKSRLLRKQVLHAAPLGSQGS